LRVLKEGGGGRSGGVVGFKDGQLEAAMNCFSILFEGRVPNN